MPKTNLYITGTPIFDSDESLYFIKVGLDNGDKTLKYTVWGKTKSDVVSDATSLINMLTNSNRKLTNDNLPIELLLTASIGEGDTTAAALKIEEYLEIKGMSIPIIEKSKVLIDYKVVITTNKGGIKSIDLIPIKTSAVISWDIMIQDADIKVLNLLTKKFGATLKNDTIQGQINIFPNDGFETIIKETINDDGSLFFSFATIDLSKKTIEI